MRRIIIGCLALTAVLLLAAPVRSPSPALPPALGIAVNLEPSASAAARQAALDAVRRTGASFFAFELSWSAAEPHPGDYRVGDVTRAARVMRQSGATLHLDLPLVTENARDVPADLAVTAFDDPKLSLRLGRLLDALTPALPDFQTLSLGTEADSYFASKPEQLPAYRRLFDGTVQFLRKKAPRLLVGVTTVAPTESRSPEIAGALHQRSPALFYIYAPFVRGTPFAERAPDSLEEDWTALVKGAAGRPIAFPVVSYSSSAVNGSSPEKQAEFIRRFRRFLAKADGRALLFARYVSLRDAAPDAIPSIPGEVSATEIRRRAFLANRGLQNAAGEPKPGWREWVKEATGVKR
ncbi:MAG TPA: hypothetical protein VGL03_08055 [Thermoanaerobaculia bacterium]